MPTYSNAAKDATEAQEALRGLAHATRVLDDPRLIYSILGSLSQSMGSLEQSLRQLADYHVRTASKQALVEGDAAAGRREAEQISARLQGAADIVRLLAASLARAHQAEASIAYGQPRRAPHVDPPRQAPPSASAGLSL